MEDLKRRILRVIANCNKPKVSAQPGLDARVRMEVGRAAQHSLQTQHTDAHVSSVSGILCAGVTERHLGKKPLPISSALSHMVPGFQ